jgi:hypothetical protein
MSKTGIVEIHEVEDQDSADKLFLFLELSQNLPFTSRTNRAHGNGNHDLVLQHSIHENRSQCSGNNYLNECCSMHEPRWSNAKDSAPPVKLASNKYEEARYLAMFQDFFEIPGATDIPC